MVEIELAGFAKKHNFYVLTQAEADEWEVDGKQRTLLKNGLVVVTGRMTREALYDLAQVEAWCRFDWAVPWEWMMERTRSVPKLDVEAVWVYPHSGGLFGFPVFDYDVVRWLEGMFLVATSHLVAATKLY